MLCYRSVSNSLRFIFLFFYANQHLFVASNFDIRKHFRIIRIHFVLFVFNVRHEIQNQTETFNVCVRVRISIKLEWHIYAYSAQSQTLTVARTNSNGCVRFARCLLFSESVLDEFKCSWNRWKLLFHLCFSAFSLSLFRRVHLHEKQSAHSLAHVDHFQLLRPMLFLVFSRLHFCFGRNFRLCQMLLFFSFFVLLHTNRCEKKPSTTAKNESNECKCVVKKCCFLCFSLVLCATRAPRSVVITSHHYKSIILLSLCVVECYVFSVK